MTIETKPFTCITVTVGELRDLLAKYNHCEGQELVAVTLWTKGKITYSRKTVDQVTDKPCIQFMGVEVETEGHIEVDSPDLVTGWDNGTDQHIN